MTGPAGIAAVQDAVVGLLTAAGIRAVIDTRDVNPPCVFVGPPALTFRFRGGGFDAEVTVQAIVGDTGGRAVTEALDELLGAVGAALNWQITQAVPAQFPGADGARTLPCYTLTVTSKGHHQ
jgi:activator of 2-hydroxyglutaryl-CoA dehydratase